jgi:mutator protein MutT
MPAAIKSPPAIRVAIAVIECDGKILICKRPAGTHLAGYWEFPGGKCRHGERWQACVRRELKEELGITIRRPMRIWSHRYRYSDRTVQLAAFRCGLGLAKPRARPGSALRWVKPQRLVRHRFPPANTALLLRLTSRLSVARELKCHVRVE